MNARQQRLLYERLVETADKQIADTFLEAVRNLTGRIPLKDLAQAIDRGDLREIEMLLRFDQGTLFPLTEASRSAYVAGAMSTGRMVAAEFTFSGLHSLAEAYVRTQGAQMVTRIDEQQREALRQVLEHRIRTGESGRKTALKITGKLNRATGRREGGFIGLNAQQTQWALNAEDDLRNLDARYFTRRQRDRRYDALVRRAIKDGKPISQADVDRITRRYRDRLLKQRGEVIARTEAHNATALGQWEQFQELARQGVTVTARWVHGGSREPRMDHIAMAGAPSRPIDQPFVMADGTRMRFPHDPSAPAEHLINCRCSVFYRVVTDA